MKDTMAQALAIEDAYRLLMQPAPAERPPAEHRTRLQALIARAKTGDADAFDELMQLEQERVLRVARRLLVSADDAPDAVQEVFLRIYRHLVQFDATQDWSPWVYRIALNVCRDVDRKRAWRRLLSLEAWREKLGDPPASTASPLAASLLEERKRLVAGGLRRLPAKERTALVLRDVEGLSAAKAAEVLGVAEATVRSHASRGRAKVKEYVRSRGGLK